MFALSTPRTSIAAAAALAATAAFASVPSDVKAGKEPHPLAATWAAHGGLDAWRAHRTMEYRLDGFPLSPSVARPSHSTIDLKDRRARIDGPDYVVAFDGDRGWVEPSVEAVGLKPRFYALGAFYFIGMPFVFADPGAVATPRGIQTYHGEQYRVVDIGYERGAGYTSKDDYTVFIDLETNRLALIHHSVAENDAVDRVTWTFDDWQEVDGVWVPAKMTFHPGFEPEGTDAGAPFTIQQVKLDQARRPDAMFAKTDAGVYDTSPELH